MDKIGIFTPTKLNTDIDIDMVVTLHHFKYAENFISSGEKHDFWEIAYVDRGEVGVVAEGHGFDLHQGDAIFHKPNEYHNIWAKNQYSNVVILSFVSQSPAMRFFENKIIQFGDEHRRVLEKILKEGNLCFKSPLNDVHMMRLNPAEAPPFGCRQVIKNYMELLLVLLIQEGSLIPRQSRASAITKCQGDSNIVEAVRKMLADSLYESIKLEDILQRVCFSKSYLTRLFRIQTGQSIMGHYLNLRLAEAQRLISEGDLSFTQIAQRLGFNSIHHFSSSFKKKTGMSPTEYRLSVR